MIVQTCTFGNSKNHVPFIWKSAKHALSNPGAVKECERDIIYIHTYDKLVQGGDENVK